MQNLLLTLALFLSALAAHADSKSLPFKLGDPACYGGGYRYKSDSYTKIYHYKMFKDKYPQCGKVVINKSSGMIHKTLSMKIIAEAKAQLANKETCPDLAEKLQKFLSDIEVVEKHLKDVALLRDENIFKKSKNMDARYEKFNYLDNEAAEKEGIHIRSIKLANAAMLCGVSDVSARIHPYWKLLASINSIIPLAYKSQSITKDGELSDGCADVSASGSEDLKEFYVNLAAADKSQALVIRYSTYSAKDHVIVSAGGKSLVDSGCVGTKEPVEKRIDLNSIKADKLKIRVKASCDGSGGSYWRVNISCVELVAPSYECQKDVDKLKKLLKKFLNNSDDLNDYYWMNSNCYNEEYEKQTGDRLEVLTNIKTLGSHYCYASGCQSIAKNPEMNTTKKIKQIKTEQLKPIKTKSLVVTTPVDYGMSAKSKKDFVENKGWYCLKVNRSIASLNKNDQPELFRQISKRYCLSAYPILLD